MENLKLTASSAYRFTACPGSVQLSQNTPDDMVFNQYQDKANLGTKIHDMCEETIKAIHKDIKPPTPAQLIKTHGVTDILDKDKSKNSIKLYSTWFKAELKKHTNPKVLIEKKFRVHKLGLECVFKADCIIYSKDRLCIADLKTGNYDYSESAFQQLAFSSEVLLELRQKYNPTEVIGTIIQPNFWLESERVVEMPIYSTGSYFEDLKDTIGSQQIKPGPHCTFCKALLTCPYMQNITQVVTALSMQSDINQVSTDTLQEIYLNKSNIEKMLSAVEGVLFSRMYEQGETLQKVMLTPKVTKRKWSDENEVKKKLKYLGNKIFDVKLKTPAQVEKIAGKKNIEGLYYKPQIQKVAPRESDFDKE